MSIAPERKINPPKPNPETLHYWEAASDGQLLMRRCTACGKPHFYPRTLCPFCLGNTEWEKVSGEGTIYTFSVMRHSEQPYVIAYVKLAEGPTMMTNIVDCDMEQVHIGQKVRLVFKPSEGGPQIPMFTAA